MFQAFTHVQYMCISTTYKLHTYIVRVQWCHEMSHSNGFKNEMGAGSDVNELRGFPVVQVRMKRLNKIDTIQIWPWKSDHLETFVTRMAVF